MRPQSRDAKILNCLIMLAEFEAMPEKAFVHKLAEWRCGSAACIGGWVALHPYFQCKGVGAYGEGMGANSYELFGVPGMFSMQWDSEWGSAKQTAINRLHSALNSLL